MAVSEANQAFQVVQHENSKHSNKLHGSSAGSRASCEVPSFLLKILRARPLKTTWADRMCFLQVMVEVSRLVERRMLRRADRSAAYAAYQRRTPFWLGWRRPQSEC